MQFLLGGELLEQKAREGGFDLIVVYITPHVSLTQFNICCKKTFFGIRDSKPTLSI